MTAPTISPYLTIIPDRSPVKKAHESLGQAQKAIVFRARASKGLTSPCHVYQWEDGKGWEVLWRFEVGTRKEDLPWQ